MRLLTLFLCLAAALQAAVPLENPRITGADAKVNSGTFTIKSGATFAVEAGAFFAFTEKLPLAAGGLGRSLIDPGADRGLFWDDSAGQIDWLQYSTGLNLTGTALSVDIGGTVQGWDADLDIWAGKTAPSGTVVGTSDTQTLTDKTLTAPTISGAMILPDNVEQVFNPGTANAGLNVGAIAGDPSAPNNGALWYNASANELTARINGVNVSLGGGGASGDVVGPASVTGDRLTLFDSGTGKLIKQSTALTNSGGVLTSNTTFEVVTGTNADAILSPNGAGKIRSGTASSVVPIGLVTIYGATEDRTAIVSRYAAGDANSAFLNFSKSRGSIASPSAASSGDALGAIYAGGFVTGSTYNDYAAMIRFQAAQAWSSGNNGTRIRIQVTPNTSASAVDRMTIDQDGRVYLGDTTAGYLSSTSGNVAVTAQGTNQNIIFTLPGSGGAVVNNTSGNAPFLAFHLAGTVKALMGTGVSAGSVITGSATDDFNVRSSTSNSINFSTDNGTSIAGRFVGSTGQFSLPKTTASTSTTTGAFVTAGGMGVAGDAYHGGIQVFNTPSVSALGQVFNTYGTTDATTGIGLRKANAALDGPNIVMSHSRGTIASPTALQSGDQIFSLTGGGHDGSTHHDFAATVRGFTTQTWTGSVHGTQVTIATTPTGSLTRADTLTISDGAGTTGFVSVLPTTAATSTTTGALRVGGGAGIAGNLHVGGALRIATSTPASASATGTTGTIAWDASYIYICTATDTWKRVAIATW